LKERILTRHPDPDKSGVNIAKAKYDAICAAIVESINDRGEITFKELTKDVQRRLSGQFEGSISWYVTTIKLDLKARNVIERIPKSKPQRLRLVSPQDAGQARAGQDS
jgi:hypothetical protein